MTLGCALSACGGGGSSPAPVAAAAPAKQAVQLPIKVAWRGDSTDWGVCTALPPTYRCSPTPAQLAQADFDKALGAGVVLVVDQSAPGSTLKQDLTGTGEFAATAYGTGQPLATVLAGVDQDASIVVTNSEINDQLVEQDTPDAYQTDMQNWITTVQAAGKTPVILEPNPVAPTALNAPSDDGSWINALAYVAAEHTAAAMYGVAVAPLYNAFIDVPQWNLVYIGPDGVHPNAAGYAYKEQQYFPTLLAVANKVLGN